MDSITLLSYSTNLSRNKRLIDFGGVATGEGHAPTLPRSYDSRKSEEKVMRYPSPNPVPGSKVFDGRRYRPTDYRLSKVRKCGASEILFYNYSSS
jgi:hypothetical protein